MTITDQLNHHMRQSEAFARLVATMIEAMRLHPLGDPDYSGEKFADTWYALYCADNLKKPEKL